MSLGPCVQVWNSIACWFESNRCHPSPPTKHIVAETRTCRSNVARKASGTPEAGLAAACRAVGGLAAAARPHVPQCGWPRARRSQWQRCLRRHMALRIAMCLCLRTTCILRVRADPRCRPSRASLHGSGRASLAVPPPPPLASMSFVSAWQALAWAPLCFGLIACRMLSSTAAWALAAEFCMPSSSARVRV